MLPCGNMIKVYNYGPNQIHTCILKIVYASGHKLLKISAIKYHYEFDVKLLEVIYLPITNDFREQHTVILKFNQT